MKFYSVETLTWTKFVGLQEMHKPFLTNIYIIEAVVYENSTRLFESSFWTIMYLEIFSIRQFLPCQITWVIVADTTQHQLRMLRSWSRANGSPGNHFSMYSTRFSPLVFDFQANYLSKVVEKSTHQKQFNFLNRNYLSLWDHIIAIHLSFKLKSFSSKKGE